VATVTVALDSVKGPRDDRYERFPNRRSKRKKPRRQRKTAKGFEPRVGG
jgi:hypothetical protein